MEARLLFQHVCCPPVQLSIPEVAATADKFYDPNWADMVFTAVWRTVALGVSRIARPPHLYQLESCATLVLPGDGATAWHIEYSGCCPSSVWLIPKPAH
jgi:hypothetical protein